VETTEINHTYWREPNN